MLRNAVWCDILWNMGWHMTIYCILYTWILFSFLCFWCNSPSTEFSYIAYTSFCCGLHQVTLVGSWMELVFLFLQQNTEVGKGLYWCGMPLFVVTHWKPPCKPVDYRCSRLKVWIVSPLCEFCASNVICVIVGVTVTEQKCLSECASEPDFNTSSMMSQSVMLPPDIQTAKCNSTQFEPQQTQHLLILWFKHQHCLACCMLLLQRMMGWSVQLKKDVIMNLWVQKSHEEILTAEWRTLASCPTLH